jgi:hypothetical protein
VVPLNADAKARAIHAVSSNRSISVLFECSAEPLSSTAHDSIAETKLAARSPRPYYAAQ